MSDPLTGTATVVVSSGVATITKVSGAYFSSLTIGSTIQISGGCGLVYSNSGTVIVSYPGWGGTSSGSAVPWTGIPPSNIQTVTLASLEILQALRELNMLPSGRLMSAAARDTLVSIDALLDLYVLNVGTTTPPGSPSEKDAYIVGTSATGAWDGQDGNVAYYLDGNWTFHAPFNGLHAFNASTGTTSIYQSGVWSSEVSGRKPYRVLTHSSTLSERTVGENEGSLWTDTSGGDIYIKSPLGVIPVGVELEVPVKHMVGGGTVYLTTDGSAETEFARITDVVDGSGAGIRTIHLTATSAVAT
jgi:hypothetical protein